MCETKFFVCRHCGNLIEMINNSGVPIKCCGENMQEISANTTEASVEKHIPVATIDGNTLTVNVGSIQHPMADNHYISWVYVETENGSLKKCLNPNDEPKAIFSIENNKPVAVYAYCNLHGLWKCEL